MNFDPVDNPLLLNLMYFISISIIGFALINNKKNILLLIGVLLLLFSLFISFSDKVMGKESWDQLFL